MFETIVHQTVNDLDNPDEIERDGPYKAQSIAESYLGSGYYFWDDHFELAQWWGATRYASNYVVCKGDLKVQKDDFLDLVGSRQDMIYFGELIREFGIETLEVGKVIEFLKDLNKLPQTSGVFPYKVIRAVINHSNNSSFTEATIKYAATKPAFLRLTPQIMICLIEKNSIILQSYTIIYPNKYVQ